MKKIFNMMMATAIAAFTFTACEDVPAPYDILADDGIEVIVIEPSGSGTEADPYNVAGILEVAGALEADKESNDSYYIKGFVTTIKENYDGGHGNAEFTIADDTKGSNKFTIYRAKYFGNQEYTNGPVLTAGDEVVVYGKVVNFRGSTLETVNGKAYLYSLNGNREGGSSELPVGEAKGTGTASDPFNVAAAIAKCKEIGTEVPNEKYYVKGTVVKDATADASYHNITFDIADTEDGAKFKCYQVKGTDGNDLPDGFSVKKGDVVVVYGPIYNYSGNTPETAGKSAAYIVTVNDKSTGDGGSSQPTGDVGSLDAPKSVAEALAAANALADNETTTANWYIKGKVTRKANTADEIGPNSDKKYKDMNYFIADNYDPTAAPSNELYIYRGKYLDGADFTAYDQLNEGDEVIIYGQLQKYIDTRNNNAVTPELKNSKIVKLNGQGGGNNDNTNSPGNDTTFGILEGNVLTLDCAGLDITGDLTTITLVDGTTMTFEKNDGRNAPIYNQSFGEFRLYARNSMTINGGNKTIYGVKFYCTTNNGVPCLGNEEELTGTGYNMSIDRTNNIIEFIRVENNVFTVTNAFAEKNSGGAQLRFNKLEITFWE